VYEGFCPGLACYESWIGPADVEKCSLGGYRAVGGDTCRYTDFS
jgi:hypothetical protein